MKLSFIKLDIDIMNDAKIKILRKMPAGNDMLVMWIGILCLAMKSGKPGVLEVGDGIPFDDEMLSVELDIEINTVRLALKTFIKLKMIDVFEDGSLYLTNFEKHQKLDKIKLTQEKTRIRVAKHRENQRLLSCNGDVTVTGVTCNATDIDKDIDKEKDIDKDKDKEETDFDLFWKLYDYKKSKPTAERAWKKLKKTDIANLLKAIPDYVASTPDKQFRKHPSTYINQRCWEDERPNVKGKGSSFNGSGDFFKNTKWETGEKND